MAQLGCSHDHFRQIGPLLQLKSSSFTDGSIAKECSCDGHNLSPELSWNDPPAGTKSFALAATDLDSPLGYSFVHWVIYNIPPDRRELPDGVANMEQLPDGSRQGHNDDDKFGYMGPCPPGHSAHRYAFDFYALDRKLELQSSATKKQLLKAIEGHVLASGEIIGRYRH